MESEGSLPHSQQPATCSCPESHRSSPCSQTHFSNIHFNIILPSAPCAAVRLLMYVVTLPMPTCLYIQYYHPFSKLLGIICWGVFATEMIIVLIGQILPRLLCRFTGNLASFAPGEDFCSREMLLETISDFKFPSQTRSVFRLVVVYRGKNC